MIIEQRGANAEIDIDAVRVVERRDSRIGHARFSDDKLHEFYDEFQEHVKLEGELYSKLMRKIDANTVATEALTKSTMNLVKVWNAAEGVATFGSWLGRVALWISSISGVIAGVWYLVVHGTPK